MLSEAELPGGALPSIRVLVVEDHVLVAEGLLSLLGTEDGIELVGHASTVAQAVELVDSSPPDVVLMDYRLPDGDGAEATTRIRARHPEVPVLMLTGTDDDATLARAVDAGCAGFLTKDQTIENVVAGLRAVAAGEALFTPEHLRRVVATRQRRPSSVSPFRFLTDRELEVLQLLADGASTEEVAQRLTLSRHTVRNHVRKILMKTGVHSKLQAVSFAAREGVVTLTTQER